MKLVQMRCDRCLESWEALARRSAYHMMDSDADGAVCGCGGSAREVPGARTFTALAPINEDGFPHYNRALGCHVRDREHYQQLLDDRGLVQIVDNPSADLDEAMPSSQREAMKEADETQQWYESYQQQLEDDSDPQFQSARRVRDIAVEEEASR